MNLTNLEYRVVDKSNITHDITKVFIQQLAKQGKVMVPSIEKLKTCCKLVLCFANEKLFGISALKLNESPALQKAGLGGNTRYF